MRLSIALTICLLLAGCGQSAGKSNLQAAAKQSDPAAANVLAAAAANGTDPQQALQQAGNAAAQTLPPGNAVASTQAGPSKPNVQARPNTIQHPNRPEGAQLPEKTVANGQ